MRSGLLLVPLSVVIMSLDSSMSAASDWTVYLHRAGPIRIGMSLAGVRRALGDPTAHLEGNSPDEVPLDTCAYLASKALPANPGFMFAKGRVVRIDVSSVGTRTASGAGVGDTEAKIKELYPGRITVEPHHYLPENGHYLNYSPHDKADREYGIVFETENGIVTSFRVGTLAAIALVEGCS